MKINNNATWNLYSMCERLQFLSFSLQAARWWNTSRPVLQTNYRGVLESKLWNDSNRFWTSLINVMSFKHSVKMSQIFCWKNVSANQLARSTGGGGWGLTAVFTGWAQVNVLCGTCNQLIMFGAGSKAGRYRTPVAHVHPISLSLPQRFFPCRSCREMHAWEDPGGCFHLRRHTVHLVWNLISCFQIRMSSVKTKAPHRRCQRQMSKICTAGSSFDTTFILTNYSKTIWWV